MNWADLLERTSYKDELKFHYLCMNEAQKESLNQIVSHIYSNSKQSVLNKCFETIKEIENQ